MPLRDHFRPPLDDLTSWEGLHGQWPAVIVQHLRKKLPAGYVAGPRVHSDPVEGIEVPALRTEGPAPAPSLSEGDDGPLAGWTPPRPNVCVETTWFDQDEYAVRIYDTRRRRQLVAAVEIV